MKGETWEWTRHILWLIHAVVIQRRITMSSVVMPSLLRGCTEIGGREGGNIRYLLTSFNVLSFSLENFYLMREWVGYDFAMTLLSPRIIWCWCFISYGTAALVPAEMNRSESCARLESPPNGDLNCLSWTWGQMCRPSCSAGHVFFRPLPSAVYLCGRDRRWKPGTSVPDCARTYHTHLQGVLEFRHLTILIKSSQMKEAGVI